jgi:uncharacterized protein (DUF488 family)
LDTPAQAPTAHRVWTIGHSNRTIDELLDLLIANEIEVVGDVRRHPGSRRWPQFAAESLGGTLPARGILYVPLPDLGGRRTPLPDSPNTAWRHPAFRGYADYMSTDAFALALSDLVNMACGLRTAIMCAEAVWWRCHRGLIADVLKWVGFDVAHILSAASPPVPHPYTTAARVVGGRLTYAARRPTRSREGV